MFATAALLTVAIALMAWFSFQQVVSTQSNIVDRVMPAMDTVRRLADHDARISALVDRLPRVDGRPEAEQIRSLLDEQLGAMAQTLAQLDAQGFDPQLGAAMRATVAAITDNLRQQTAQTLRRLDTEEAERTAVMHRRESLKALQNTSESLVANASTTTTANIANLYRLLDGGSKPPRLFEALDRLIEVDIDGMERMAQFQLLCFKLQTLLAQVEAQTSPEGVDQLNQAFAASLAPLKRRIDDLRDPSQRELSLAHYHNLAGEDIDDPFRTHRQRLEIQHTLGELRARGHQLGGELNRQAGELVSTGGEAMGAAGAQARRAVDRGLILFVAVAGLLFFTLIITVWAVFRYHLLGRLNGWKPPSAPSAPATTTSPLPPASRTRWAPSGGPSSSSARTPASGCASRTSCGATSRCSRARSPNAPPNSNAATRCSPAKWPSTPWPARPPRRPTRPRACSSAPSATSCAPPSAACSAPCACSARAPSTGASASTST